MEARVTAQSQAYRLRERLQEANISDGQEVRADLFNLRVTPLALEGEGEVLFCRVKPIQVKQVANPGDGLPLPTTVTMEGLTVSGPGTFDLLNALVSSNGGIRIIIDHQTRVVPK